jgi:hypothetical protein
MPAFEPTVHTFKTISVTMKRRVDISQKLHRIGHTHVIFLLDRKEPPECTGCKTRRMVEHMMLPIFLYCIEGTRKQLFLNLSEKFKMFSLGAVVYLIKDIRFHWKSWILSGFNTTAPSLVLLVNVLHVHLDIYFIMAVDWSEANLMNIKHTKTKEMFLGAVDGNEISNLLQVTYFWIHH